MPRLSTFWRKLVPMHIKCPHTDITMLQPPDRITTQRLVLRQPRLSDAEAIFEYASDPKVVHYMDYPPRTDMNDMIKYLDGHSKRWALGNFSWVITIKVTAPDLDQAIGTIACSKDEHALEFGYLLNQKAWGQGYATEAACTIVEWAVRQPSIHRIWATCDTENLASARVLEKCGLSLEGTLSDYVVRPNISSRPRDAFIYAR